MKRRSSSSTSLSRFRLAPALLLLLLPWPTSWAQQTQDPPAATFSERLDVRLVTLPVLARDRQGRPVTDLRAEEIQIVEGRQRHQVAFVTPFFEDADERKGIPPVRLMMQAPGRSVEIAKSSAREPRHLLVLVDLMNDPPVGRLEALESLSQFLEHELDPSFQIAIMVFDGGDLDLRLGFTHDRGEVVRRLRLIAQQRVRSRDSPEARMEIFIQKLSYCRIEDPSAPLEEDREFGRTRAEPVVDPACLRDTVYEYTGELLPRALGFIEAIEGAVKYAAGLDGHTFVLTVGGNVGLSFSREVGETMRAIYGPLDEINQLEQQLYGEDIIRPYLERAIQLAYQENVSLSFLDRSTAPSDFSARQARVHQAGFRPLMTAFQSAQQGLDEIAASTGGVFVASPRVATGLQETLKLVEGGYYVSFYLRDDEPLTQRRIDRFRVQSSRSGLVLKHRRAFEGVRKEERPSARRVRGIIQVGFPEQQEFQGESGNIIPLRLVLDPRDLGYKETEANATAEFTVHLRLVTPKGTLLADAYQVLTHSYTRDDWNSGQFEPPDLMAWADLPDGDYFAEAVVTVPELGHRGTIRRHIIVRGSDLPLEGVVKNNEEREDS